MNKYNFFTTNNDYELKTVLEYIEENKYKLISVSSFNNSLYIFYEK